MAFLYTASLPATPHASLPIPLFTSKRDQAQTSFRTATDVAQLPQEAQQATPSGTPSLSPSPAPAEVKSRDFATEWSQALLGRFFYSPRLSAYVQLASVLGHGGHGHVFHANVYPTTASTTSLHYVVKYVPDRHQGLHEEEIHAWLTDVEAAHVVALVDAVTDAPAVHGGLGGVFLLLEHCNKGDLLAWTTRNFFPERTQPDLTPAELKEARQQARRQGLRHFLTILSAMRDCHELGVYHRDLKLENCLLTQKDESEEVRALLSDFGVATRCQTSCQFRHGTEATMAPEVLLGAGYCDSYRPELADRWSLGVLLYQLTTGYSLWPRADPERSAEFAYYCERAVFGGLMGARALQGLSRSCPPELALGDRLARIIASLLRIEPLERASLHSVAQEVEQLLK